jgi:ectoine hydroxylase-related dioxygenase (phytanoyl-CoA dioxygenase family)
MDSVQDASVTFRRDGVVCLRDALDADALALVRDVFAYRLENARRSIDSSKGADGSVNYSDLFKISTWQHETFLRLFEQTPVAGIAAALLGTENLWFFYEQLFVKQSGAVARTPWHQDTPYLNAEGDDIVRLWITLDPVPEAGALEFVRGSHGQTLYNGSAFDPADETRPLYPGSDLPRLPAIEQDRSSWDIVSFPVEPGDIVAFHPKMLHGGAPTTAKTARRTLALMFFGDDATYVERPTNPMFVRRAQPADLGATATTEVAARDGFAPKRLYAGLRPGDPFRDPAFPKLLPRSGTAPSA